MMLSLPNGENKYETYNLMSGLTASILGTATLTTLSAVSLVPLFVGIPLILMTSAISLATISSIADKIKRGKKKRVSWADNLEKHHYYPTPKQDDKERTL